MSIEAMSYVLKHIRGLKPTDRLVLLVLANYSHPETGQCFPSIKTLAASCELRTETIRAALRRLEEGGYLKTTPRFNDIGRQTSNSYEITQPMTDGAYEPRPSSDAGGTPPSDAGVSSLNGNMNGGSKKRSRRGAVEITDYKVPAALDDTETLQSIADWLEHRATMKLPKYKTSKWLDEPANWGAARARAAITVSIAREYHGIYEASSKPQKSGKPAVTFADDEEFGGVEFDPSESEGAAA